MKETKNLHFYFFKPFLTPHSRKMLLMLLLGFSSGFPLALTGGTLQAWLTIEGISLKSVGTFSLVGLPYTLKFIWSPYLDSLTLPFLGRRRGWIFLIQIAIASILFFMSLLHPKEHLFILALSSLVLAFFSATQDVVIDAYRTELLEKDEYGSGSAMSIFGYRLAMLFSGGLALYLSRYLTWPQIYITMSLVMGCCALIPLFSKEPQLNLINETDKPKKEEDDFKNKPRRSLLSSFAALVPPLREFFSRVYAFEILAFVFLYKLGEIFAVLLQTPFMLQIGFSAEVIGKVAKTGGLLATISGGFLGGYLIPKLGLKRSLLVFGVLQAFSIFSFYMLAVVGNNFPLMVTAVVLENFFNGMGNAAFVAFLMTLCDIRFTATQYALLTSLYSIPRVFFGRFAGDLSTQYGWEAFFIFSILLTIPAILLLIFRGGRWVSTIDG
jgi:MFS transporter, PAT family, beta-lactamase induction signal transducer AmpG